MTMNKLILFIYESGICMAALYGIYWLFLRKETYFKFNRSLLLSTVIFVSIIPLINFSPLNFRSETSALAIITGIGEANGIPSKISIEGANTVFNPSHLWLYLIAGIYLIGVLFIIIRIILGLFRVA